MNCIIPPTRDDAAGGLYLGNISGAGNQKLIEKYKIRAVLTVAQGTYLKYPKQYIDQHKVVEALDLPSYDLFKHFQECIDFIAENIKKTNVLVHCFAGSSRSGTIVIAYIMQTRDMTYDQAYKMVRQCRSQVFPNIGFVRQL